LGSRSALCSPQARKVLISNDETSEECCFPNMVFKPKFGSSQGYGAKDNKVSPTSYHHNHDLS